MAIIPTFISVVATILSLSDANPQIFSNAGGITNIATLSTGPFAVRTVETPSVGNTQIGRNALRQRQTEFSHSTIHGGVASPSLFQTADGRIFALSNGRNFHQFAPGQIFQSADGRFFTIAAASPTSSSQSVLPQEPSTSVVSTSSSNKPREPRVFQAESAINNIIDARINIPSTTNRVVNSSPPTSMKPTSKPTTTESTSPLASNSLNNTISTPSTTSSTNVIGGAQPGIKSKTSLAILSSFGNIFGRRTKPLTPPSTFPLKKSQQGPTNQNTMSSFDLRKIARKNKSISDSVMKNNELQALDDHILQQKQEAEIQQEQLMQQQLRLQLQRQELQLKRLQQMQLELQKQQEKRQRELLQRHQKKQEILRMQQQKQLEELNKEQKKQLEELQRQQEQEQKAHMGELRRQKSLMGLKVLIQL